MPWLWLRHGAKEPLGFEYGWVRGAGSAAFIAASIIAGWAIAWHGLSIVIWLQALLMLTVPFAVMRVPAVGTTFDAPPITREGIVALLRLPVFRRVVLVASLILGSHALHDTFSVIRWKAAGVSPQTISLLWSLSVAGEVLVFFVVGPWLLRRLTPAAAIALAAAAGAARWFVAALTTDVMALSVIQPLHGVTFALLHLACMRLLARAVPDELAATAQAIYGTVGVGAATAAAHADIGISLCAHGRRCLCRHERALSRRAANRALIEKRYAPTMRLAKAEIGSTRKLRSNACGGRAFVVIAANARPVERSLAHRAWRCRGIHVAIGKIPLVEPPRGVAYREELGVGGRVAVEHDVVPALAHDHTVADDHRAVGLVPFFHGLVAQRPRPCEIAGLRLLRRLREWLKVRAGLRDGRCGAPAKGWKDER